MTLHILSPYSLNKNLGSAYNESMSLIPEDDWVCFKDIDAMFLHPSQPKRIYDYIAAYPDAGILTCYTNRISTLSPQLLNGRMSSITDMNHWVKEAGWIIDKPIKVKAVADAQDISGFCMVISKKTWNTVKFPEYMDRGGCIGVDTMYRRGILAAGLKVLIMETIIMFHLYRLGKAITDKSHLYA